MSLFDLPRLLQEVSDPNSETMRSWGDLAERSVKALERQADALEALAGITPADRLIDPIPKARARPTKR